MGTAESATDHKNAPLLSSASTLLSLKFVGFQSGRAALSLTAFQGQVARLTSTKSQFFEEMPLHGWPGTHNQGTLIKVCHKKIVSRGTSSQTPNDENTLSGCKNKLSNRYSRAGGNTADTRCKGWMHRLKQGQKRYSCNMSIYISICVRK